jgi:hypothetical protein
MELRKAGNERRGVKIFLIDRAKKGPKKQRTKTNAHNGAICIARNRRPMACICCVCRLPLHGEPLHCPGSQEVSDLGFWGKEEASQKERVDLRTPSGQSTLHFPSSKCNLRWRDMLRYKAARPQWPPKGACLESGERKQLIEPKSYSRDFCKICDNCELCKKYDSKQSTKEQLLLCATHKAVVFLKKRQGTRGPLRSTLGGKGTYRTK